MSLQTIEGLIKKKPHNDNYIYIEEKINTLTSNINELDSGKVDKIVGKQLSTEDYTTEEKIQVGKIGGIEQQVATQSDDIATHLASEMPHKIKDLKANKIYRYGFQLSAEVKPQIIYEEVI